MRLSQESSSPIPTASLRTRSRVQATVVALGLVGVTGIAISCGGGGGSPTGASLTQFFSVTNGFGAPLLPLRIAKPDANGNPTTEIVEIRDLKTLTNNKPSAINPVLPVATWPLDAILPDQSPGNHFMLIQFGGNFTPDEKSILDPNSPTGLTGALTVTALDPVSGVQTNVKGRMFVNGRTTRNGAIETWVVKGPAVAPGLPEPLASQVAAGFPGIATSFAGSDRLVGLRSIVFIPDVNDDLSKIETFPTARNIRITVGTGVRSKGGAFWPQTAVAVSTVGPDNLTPEVSVNPGTLTPVTEPALNATLVPVDRLVQVDFTEPIQPFTVGPVPSQLPPPVTGGVRLSFAVGQNTVLIPFTALPENPFNFTRIVLTPAFSFPGSFFKNGPAGLPAPEDVVFSVTIDMTTLSTFTDLVGRKNSVPRTATFTTGAGAGIVNAPVSPGVIYLGFGGQTAGIGVLDLDGFGQGTGTPIQDNPQTLPIEPGTSNFKNNPDLNLALTPPLTVQNTSLAGGSLGPLTLARDSSTVTFVFAQPPLVNGVRDMAIGGPLDVLFNNGICLSGGGNFCAKDSFHVTNGNTITTSPAPNPPKLIFPPLCLAPFIGAEEPISARNIGASLIKPGNWKGNPASGIPPQGSFSDSPTPYGATWPGPDLPPTQPPFACVNYTVRQQIGHFLYVIDPVVRRVVVLNSNRMTVVTSIPQPDPVNMSMSPDLKLLAVTNSSTNQVQYINTDPLSVNFHKVVATTNVGVAPIGIAWQPDGEDLMVACTGSNTLDIIQGQSLTVRKTVSNQLQQPFDVAITSRQVAGLGFATGVYFAYVLNRNGSVAIYESGPAGLQGIGFDDLIGLVQTNFAQPTAIQPDTSNLNSGVWIVHKTTTGLPTASNLALTSSPVGPIPFNNFIIFPSPSFRNREYTVVQTVQPAQFSGNAPQDIAFDDFTNNGNIAVGLFLSGGVPGATVLHSSKKHVRPVPGGFIPASTPKAIFFTSFDSGKIDVVDRITGLRIVEPIDAPQAQIVAHYWRQ